MWQALRLDSLQIYRLIGVHIVVGWYDKPSTLRWILMMSRFGDECAIHSAKINKLN